MEEIRINGQTLGYVTDDEDARITHGDSSAPKPRGTLNAKKTKRLFPFEPGQARIRGRRVGRNQACPCGSGKKFKRCHGRQNHTFLVARERA